NSSNRSVRCWWPITARRSLRTLARLRRSERGPSAGAARRGVSGGLLVPGHLCRGPAGWTPYLICRDGPAIAASEIPDRRRPVSNGFSLGGQYLLCPAPAATRAPGLLQFFPLNSQCHSSRHGGDGLLPFGPLV